MELKIIGYSPLSITSTLGTDKGNWPSQKGGRFRETGFRRRGRAEIKYIYLKRLLVAYKYVTQTKYINKTETKLKQEPTMRGTDIKFPDLQ